MEDLREDLLGRLELQESRIYRWPGSSGLASRFHGNLIMSKPLGWSGSSALLDKLSK